MPESQPNYLTVSSTGDTSALFSGGLQLIAAGPAGFSDPGKGVSWIRDPVLGGLAASIVGVNEDALQNRLDARAYNAAGTRSAAFSASADATTARLSADVGGAFHTIMDSLGVSRFVQNLTEKRLRLNCGMTTATTATTATVAHGLGVTPVCAIATPQLNSVARITGHIYSVDGTNINILNTTVTGETANFYWLALAL